MILKRPGQEKPYADPETEARIVLDTDGGRVHWIYFDPASSAGGRYVSGDLGFSVFEELIEQYDRENHPENAGALVNDVLEMSDQFFADANTPFFPEAKNDYEADCDYVGFAPENLLKIHEDILSRAADRDAERALDYHEAIYGADGYLAFHGPDDPMPDPPQPFGRRGPRL